MSKPETITVNDVKYVRADAAMAPEDEGLRYCVIRTYSAGVHIGYVYKHAGQEVVLINSRRLWRWSGAASLSQVATEGCQSDKFAVTLPEITLTDVIEIIPCTEKAKEVLDALPEWRA